MLNDQEFSKSEVIIFENLKRAAKKINDLEDLDEDRWATVAYLCDKVTSLEKVIKNLERGNQDLKKVNETLLNKNIEVDDRLKKIFGDPKQHFQNL